MTAAQRTLYRSPSKLAFYFECPACSIPSPHRVCFIPLATVRVISSVLLRNMEFYWNSVPRCCRQTAIHRTQSNTIRKSLILFNIPVRAAWFLPQYCEFAQRALIDFSHHWRSAAFAQMARSPDHPQAFTRQRRLMLKNGLSGTKYVDASTTMSHHQQISWISPAREANLSQFHG